MTMISLAKKWDVILMEVAIDPGGRVNKAD